jgi:hypothetical protein
MTDDVHGSGKDVTRELSDADLEALVGGKSRGVISENGPSSDGFGSSTHTYSWRGWRFRPR